jgi:hypothetical protein
MNFKKLVAGLATGCFLMTGAFAAFKKVPGHPRVNQVNRRYVRQGVRIRQGVKNGQLTKQEAHKLNAERRAFKKEERAMRKQNNGHLTKANQRALNRQENKMSRQIYHMKHNKKTAPKTK